MNQQIQATLRVVHIRLARPMPIGVMPVVHELPVHGTLKISWTMGEVDGRQFPCDQKIVFTPDVADRKKLDGYLRFTEDVTCSMFGTRAGDGERSLVFFCEHSHWEVHFYTDQMPPQSR